MGSATLWAQLPPSALNPVRPSQPVPGQPLPGNRPVNPLQPIRPQIPPAAPVAPVAPESPAAIDLSNTIPNTLTSEEQAQGWKLLFDGTRLTGLRGVERSDPLSAGWKIENGEVNLPKEVKEMGRMTGGDLITTEAYWDFDFRFEWKASVSANSGVRYMLGQASGQTPPGLEYQILDDVHTPIGLKGGTLRRAGSLDNILPVGSNAVLRTADPLNRKGDPWNEGRIVVQGTHVEHWMNGEKVLEFELGPQLRSLAERNAERGSNNRFGPYFGSKVKTQLCLLDEGAEIAFRNLKIRAIVPQAVVAQPNAPRGTGTPAVPGVPGITPGPKSGVPDPFLIKPKR